MAKLGSGSIYKDPPTINTKAVALDSAAISRICKRKAQKAVFAALAATLVGVPAVTSMTATDAFAGDEGASAGNVGGYGGGTGSGYEYRFWAYDAPDRSSHAYTNTMRNWPGWSDKALEHSETDRHTLRATYVATNSGVCYDAVTKGIAKYGGERTDYRVVLLGGFLGDWTSPTRPGKIPYRGSPDAGNPYRAFEEQWPSMKKELNADTDDKDLYHERVYNLALEALSADGQPPASSQTAHICVVLNKSQPNSLYDVSVSTQAQNTFVEAGGTGAVHDSVTITSTPAKDENVDVETILTWDGNAGSSSKSVSKMKSMPVNSTTRSPDFTPSDFGWDVWSAGNFWYDVRIAKQGNMSAAVDTPDRLPSESWGSGFKLAVGTNHTATFSLAGANTAVTDVIHANSFGSQITEPVNANVILTWDGVTGNGPKSVTKSMRMGIDGDSRSPQFTPADFGWGAWPSGQFWFDIQVPKQGEMTEAVDTPDRDSAELWRVDVPPPVKTLTSGSPEDELKDHEVLASGMFYNAKIKGNSAGYRSMTITDEILTDKVMIGSRDSDVASSVYVIDPSGSRVSDNNVNVNIQRNSGKVEVSATVNNIPDHFQGLEYTLVVPTYVQPTKSNYTITDNSRVDYPGNKRVTGNSKTTRKVTPTPDKVWVLDENGALVTADPAHTNQEGSDQKVFLMNDAVSAVVNGSIHKDLAENLDNYVIVDDWSESAKYVDFSDVNKAQVFYETAPGSGEYSNVTSQFTLEVEGTKTIATAKSEFLNRTKGLTGDRKVKLVISGKFRDDYDTDGQIVKLTNAGSETWNNETIPTNEPPVFTWTPDPEKQVLGSSEEDGPNAYSDINGMQVFPGQKLEYSIGVDLRVPSNTARGVKTLSVKDVYDPKFTPDARTIEFWDSRDATNPKPVPAKYYKVKMDPDNHSFQVDFDKKWIDENVNNTDYGPENSEWMTKGWLTMRFTGTVKDDVEAGSLVQNQAFQIINGASTETEIPVVRVPVVNPDKEDLDTNLNDIDGKTVVEGDKIVYRVTLDATVKPEELAYYVHKLGIVDDFDEEYLDVSESSVRVTDVETGEDVTDDKFNVQVKDGKLGVFAKTIDYETYDGRIIKGDPQPEDLFAYDQADIVSGESAIIDQELLGKKYYITFQATVKKETDGYVIENQAVQNIENMRLVTKIVSNPIKDIDPDKDVVVSEETKDESIDASEVKLNSDFNYRLNSSSIPANRAYKASQWSITDTFDRAYDQYTGIWAIYANEDLYDGDELIFKKGDLLQDSAGHETEPGSELFAVTFDENSYTFKAEATDKFLDFINTRQDLSQSFSVYTKMLRIAPGERIENKAIESYNDYERETNVVWTHTPENPAISVEKYTLVEGLEKGDRDDIKLAYETTGKETMVGFDITNTGDVDLKELSLEDATLEGTYGSVANIFCEAPDYVGIDKIENIGRDGKWTDISNIETLAVGETLHCQGSLNDMLPGMTHGDNVVVTGKSVFTDKVVTDEDPWYAKIPSTPAIEVEKYTLDEGLTAGDRDTYKDALELTDEQANNGVLIGFDVTNTGDEDLTDVTFVDETQEATTGKVENIKWIREVTAEQKQDLIDKYNFFQSGTEAASIDEEVVEGAVAVETTDGEVQSETIDSQVDIDRMSPTEPQFMELGGKTYHVQDVSLMTGIARGETMHLIGTLTGVEAGTPHGDIATATGTGIFSGTKVEDKDPWYARRGAVPCPTCIPPKGAVTGEGFDDINVWLLGLGLVMVASAGGAGYIRYRKLRSISGDVE